jgi:hypothetical protein
MKKIMQKPFVKVGAAARAFLGKRIWACFSESKPVRPRIGAHGARVRARTADD